MARLTLLQSSESMYPRVNTVKQGAKSYHYLQILQSYRHHGKARQRLVVNLGRIDLLQDNLGPLVASLSEHCQSVNQKFDVAETAFVLIANRLCEPSSEHGLADG
jgi:hypothetical protein